MRCGATSRDYKDGQQNAELTSILAFLDVVETNGLDKKSHDFKVRFGDLGGTSINALKSAVRTYTEAVHFAECDDPSTDRVTVNERHLDVMHPVMMSVWQEILADKRSKDPHSKVYTVKSDTDGRKADILSVFDGPRGDIIQRAEDQGLCPMQPIDKDQDSRSF